MLDLVNSIFSVAIKLPEKDWIVLSIENPYDKSFIETLRRYTFFSLM